MPIVATCKVDKVKDGGGGRTKTGSSCSQELIDLLTAVCAKERAERASNPRFDAEYVDARLGEGEQDRLAQAQDPSLTGDEQLFVDQYDE